ncbi:10904_t:CDS:1, partial [Funneliformis geosporum]
EELEKIDNETGSIICEIRLEECGKNIVPKSVQALMIAHKENKLALYNANHNVKQLKTKIT